MNELALLHLITIHYTLNMNLPILDTEEKLREYLNKVAGCEVDPLTIKAHIFPDHVHLDTNHDPGIHIAFAQSSPRWFQIQSYGMVDRAVIPVLRELHSRHDKEIQEAFQKRWEESCKNETERNYTGSLEQIASKANMTPDRFMEVNRGLEKKNSQAPRSARAALPHHPNPQPLQMNLQYIQTELFREIVGMEPQLKPEYRFHLIRDTDGALSVYLVYKPNPMKYVDFPYIVVRDITTPDQITAEINRILQEIPAECKKENILK